ncbi:hypothetical protein IKG50_01045 [Candidatus Saccharibacteria bacterium]|nr:hypothetical protein [Candidatus Saccharibacteria bacterium]
MKQWGGDLNYRPEKKSSNKKRSRVVEPVKTEPRKNERDYRVGKTIAGATNNARKRNLEHIAVRKKQQRKNAIIVFLILVLIVGLSIFIGQYINEKIAEREAQIVASNPTEPTVAIVDENVGDNISKRVKVFVARLEADAADKNLKVDHVTLPFQKAREVLVFFVGRKEYYKMTIERGSTVQIEDAERMMRYLDGKGLAPEYVDIRVEGKAYFK